MPPRSADCIYTIRLPSMPIPPTLASSYAHRFLRELLQLRDDPWEPGSGHPGAVLHDGQLDDMLTAHQRRHEGRELLQVRDSELLLRGDRLLHLLKVHRL